MILVILCVIMFLIMCGRLVLIYLCRIGCSMLWIRFLRVLLLFGLGFIIICVSVFSGVCVVVMVLCDMIVLVGVVWGVFMIGVGLVMGCVVCGWVCLMIGIGLFSLRILFLLLFRLLMLGSGIVIVVVCDWWCEWIGVLLFFLVMMCLMDERIFFIDGFVFIFFIVMF